MNKLIALLLAQIFIRLPLPYALHLLQELELGVYLFCRRQAETQSEPLKSLFFRQSLDEYQHAQIFAKLAGIELKSAADIMNRKDAVNWGRIPTADGKIGSPVDGMSSRYLCARFFFQGKVANSYEIGDKLAYMEVLERFQVVFYHQLAKICIAPLNQALAPILIQEQEHADDLKLRLMYRYPQNYRKLIRKWERRKAIALLIAPFDLIKLVGKSALNIGAWVVFSKC